MRIFIFFLSGMTACLLLQPFIVIGSESLLAPMSNVSLLSEGPEIEKWVRSLTETGYRSLTLEERVPDSKNPLIAFRHTFDPKIYNNAWAGKILNLLGKAQKESPSEEIRRHIAAEFLTMPKEALAVLLQLQSDLKIAVVSPDVLRVFHLKQAFFREDSPEEWLLTYWNEKGKKEAPTAFKTWLIRKRGQEYLFFEPAIFAEMLFQSPWISKDWLRDCLSVLSSQGLSSTARPLFLSLCFHLSEEPEKTLPVLFLYLLQTPFPTVDLHHLIAALTHTPLSWDEFQFLEAVDAAETVLRLLEKSFSDSDKLKQAKENLEVFTFNFLNEKPARTDNNFSSFNYQFLLLQKSLHTQPLEELSSSEQDELFTADNIIRSDFETQREASAKTRLTRSENLPDSMYMEISRDLARAFYQVSKTPGETQENIFSAFRLQPLEIQKKVLRRLVQHGLENQEKMASLSGSLRATLLLRNTLKKKNQKEFSHWIKKSILPLFDTPEAKHIMARRFQARFQILSVPKKRFSAELWLRLTNRSS